MHFELGVGLVLDLLLLSRRIESPVDGIIYLLAHPCHGYLIAAGFAGFYLELLSCLFLLA